MDPVKRIVVGVDLSTSGDEIAAGGRASASLALELAVKCRAVVRLVHSSHAEEHYEQSPDGRVWTPREGASPRGVAALEELRSRFEDAGVEAILEISDRRPWLAIIADAVENHADVVVVGKRSHSDFESDFDDRKLGAVAVKLLRKCPSAVWTVNPQRAGSAPATPRRILAASDLSEVMGSKVIRSACFLARVFDAPLHLLHAFPLSWPEGLILGASGREQKRLRVAEKCERELRAAVESAGGCPSLEIHVSSSPPTYAIISTAKQVKADAVVMGTISRSGVRGVLVGNTAERVFGSADVSLLTLKPDDFELPFDL